MEKSNLQKIKIVQSLSRGWTSNHYGFVEKFIQILESKFPKCIEISGIESNIARISIDLSTIRLRGLVNVPCLLIGAKDPSIIPKIKNDQRDMSGTSSIPFVFAFSDWALCRAKEIFHTDNCLILSAETILQFVQTDDSKEFLAKTLREYIPLKRLIPFSILRPAEHSMFVGRKEELNSLIHEKDTSFAIAGPSRIGKTSLIRQYQTQMILREGASRLRPYINFYYCPDKTDYGISKYIATKLETSNRAQQTDDKSLPLFLEYLTKKHGIMPELLLDEVDEVCMSHTFEALGTVAKDGYCRVIMCGRGELLNTILNAEATLTARLELIRPEPLLDNETADLLIGSLSELGIFIADPVPFLAEISLLTGNLPHLVQYYGQKLSLLAIKNQTIEIDLSDAKTIRDSYETVQYYLSPFNRDIIGSIARFVALSIMEHLVDNPDEEISIPWAQGLIGRKGVTVDYRPMKDICDHLVVHNVLSWFNGKFKIANKILPSYAREHGLLGAGLMEAQRLVKSGNRRISSY